MAKWKVTLPEDLRYNGRVGDLENFTCNATASGALAAVLKRDNVLFLYREFSTSPFIRVERADEPQQGKPKESAPNSYAIEKPYTSISKSEIDEEIRIMRE